MPQASGYFSTLNKLDLNGHENQTVKLPDGRALGFAEYGSATGFPVLCFPGFPSSRLEFTNLDALAKRQHLRIIALDRPGFGLSTFQPKRKILDWPADVTEFARQKNLKQFAVMGASGGGPYAIACAYAMSREMIVSVGVVACSPPWSAGENHIRWFVRLEAWAVERVPRIYGGVLSATLGLVRWFFSLGPVIRHVDKTLAKLKHEGSSPMDANTTRHSGDTHGQTLQQDRDQLLRLGFEPFVQGVDAYLQESKILASDWGFNLKDVNFNPITMIHGTKDANVPIHLVRSLAAQLPHGRLREFEEDTHYTIARHLGAFFAHLIPVDVEKELEQSSQDFQTVPKVYSHAVPSPVLI